MLLVNFPKMDTELTCRNRNAERIRDVMLLVVEVSE